MVSNERAARNRWIVGALLLAWSGLPEAAWAIPNSLPAAVPSDAVAAWFVDRAPDQPTGTLGHVNVARFLVDQAGELGLLSRVDPISRGWIDTLSAVSLLLDYPHAVALFQMRSRELPDGGHRLESLHGGLIIHRADAGSHAPQGAAATSEAGVTAEETRANGFSAIEQRIQRLLNSYTNRDESQLRTAQLDGGVVHRLSDRRLPEWVTLSWGAVGDCYVIALGDGSFERIADAIKGRKPSLLTQAWFAHAAEKLSAEESWVSVWVNFAGLQDAADKALTEKADRVRDALGLRGVERGLWVVRDPNRALQVTGLVTIDGKDHTRALTSNEVAGLPASRVVPREARGYAIFDTTPRQVLMLFREAYLAGRGARARERTFEYWRDLEQTAGISIDREIFGNLGRGVIIHDHPQHALRLPLLWSFVAPVVKNPSELRVSLDALMTAWQAELREGDANVQLRREEDGIWCMFIGINGPAVGLSDRWLVVSFSPQAVRQNLEFLRSQPPLAADMRP